MSPRINLAGVNRGVVLGICVFLAVITWIVFGQTLGHEFINYDDYDYVVENAEVTQGLTLHGIGWAFTHSHAHNWHPLTTITHMLDCQLFGLKAGAHHGTNVLLHMVAALLLFLVLREMTGGPPPAQLPTRRALQLGERDLRPGGSSPRDESVPRRPDRTGNIWPSAFVAAVFAIHPLHVESVAWVAERKDVLSGLFFMLTLAAYLRYVRKPSLRRYLLVAFVFALGLMSKPMLVTLPLVLLLLDYWPLGRVREAGPALSRTEVQTSEIRDQRSVFRGQWSVVSLLRRGYGGQGGQWSYVGLVLEKLPLLLLSAASSVVTLVVQRQGIRAIEILPVWVRVYQAFVSCLTYICQMFWPARLAAFYPYPTGRLSLWPLVFAIAVLVIVTVTAFKLRKQRPYFITGWLWYLGMLVPVIGIIQVGMQGQADRYTYLPHIGLYLLVAWTVTDLSASLKHRREILTVMGATVIVILTWCAWVQTTYWKNSKSLWTRALMATGDNAVAHTSLGNALIEEGKMDEAFHHYQRAVHLHPIYAQAHYNLGTALFQRGDIDQAIACWQKTLLIEPNEPKAHANLGDALIRKGLLADALAHYEKSLQAAAPVPATLSNYAWLLSTCSDAQLRNGPRAIQLAQQADQLAEGKNPVFLRTLAAAYAESGWFNDAIGAAQRALQLAVAKGDSALASKLRMDIDLYRMNFPVRDRTLTNTPDLLQRNQG